MLRVSKPILQQTNMLCSVICLPVQTIHRDIYGELVPSNLSLRQITKVAQFVKDNGAQGTGVLHGQLQCGVGLLLTSIVMYDATMEGGSLIGIQVVTGKLATSYTTNRMNEVAAVQILKPVLIRVMRVGTTIEVHRQQIFLTVLVTSVLRSIQYTCDNGRKKTYSVFLFIEHEGHNSATGIGAGTGLTANSNGGTTPAVLILGAGNGTSGHWHSGLVDERRE